MLEVLLLLVVVVHSRKLISLITVVDHWRPEVRFYHGRRAFGVDAVRVYHGRRAFGVDEALSTSVWCRRGACLSW